MGKVLLEVGFFLKKFIYRDVDMGKGYFWEFRKVVNLKEKDGGNKYRNGQGSHVTCRSFLPSCIRFN